MFAVKLSALGEDLQWTMPHADSPVPSEPNECGWEIGCRWLLPLISRVGTTLALCPLFFPSMGGWLLSATHLEKPAPLAGETPTRSHGN
jgi:hypothetical protein